MKITSLETFLVPPRWLFLKIETDEGLIGWGEPVIEGRAETVSAAVKELADYLIGEDPLQIEKHWQRLYRGGFYRGGPILMSALAGIDQALWDIKGKYHRTPVHQLLGGQVRDRIRVYAWVGGDRPGDIEASAKRAIEDGFSATKMNITEEMQVVDQMRQVDAAVERIARLRDIRPNISLSSDFIVGFPGESDQDFADTLALVSKVGYASAYSFKYSPRPGTPASEEAQIDEDVKSERLARLQDVLNIQQVNFNASQAGETLEVLFEKQGKKPGQMVGRSPYLQTVHVDADETVIGKILPVKINLLCFIL